MKSTDECSKDSCPFAGTDASDIVQNYACLPTAMQIIAMRQNHGKTWACHSDPSKPCAGAIEYQKEAGMEYRPTFPLMDESSDWGDFQ